MMFTSKLMFFDYFHESYNSFFLYATAYGRVPVFHNKNLDSHRLKLVRNSEQQKQKQNEQSSLVILSLSNLGFG